MGDTNIENGDDPSLHINEGDLILHEEPIKDEPIPPELQCLTDFQKMKFLHVFGTFYDVNGDGVIDWTDFECDLSKLAGLLNWNDEQKNHAKATLLKIWDGLKNYADLNQDDKVSQEEWLRMWGDCCLKSKDKETLPPWLDDYVIFMFKANDINNDGCIDINEYNKFFTEYGLIEKDCIRAYNAITQNGARTLNLETYKEIWHQYFLSQDPKASANSLFGVNYAK